MTNKKKLVLTALAVAAVGLTAASAIPTLAAFATHKNLNRNTTIKRVIYLETANTDWSDGTNTDNTHKRYSAYVWNSTIAGSGQFANNGAFMKRVSHCLYETSIPSDVDRILFVWHYDDSTVASWDNKVGDNAASQTVDMTISGDTYNKFILYNTTNFNPASDGEYHENVQDRKKGGKWFKVNSGNYTYNPHAAS